jgi:hypothetical protein
MYLEGGGSVSWCLIIQTLKSEVFRQLDRPDRENLKCELLNKMSFRGRVQGPFLDFSFSKSLFSLDATEIYAR